MANNVYCPMFRFFKADNHDIRTGIAAFSFLYPTIVELPGDSVVTIRRRKIARTLSMVTIWRIIGISGAKAADTFMGGFLIYVKSRIKNHAEATAGEGSKLSNAARSKITFLFI